MSETLAIKVSTSFDESKLPKIKFDKNKTLDLCYQVMDLYNDYKVKCGNEWVSNNSESVEYTTDEKKAYIFTTHKQCEEYTDCKIVIIPKKFDNKKLKDAKEKLASVRKLSKEVNAKKIQLKKDYNVNVVKFENDIKEVLSVFKVIDVGIDEQVKLFESNIKQARKNEIQSWEEWKAIEDYQVFDDSWLLKKWTDKLLQDTFTTIKETIESQLSAIKMNADTLKLDSDKYVALLKKDSYNELTPVLERMKEDYELLNSTKEEETPTVVVDDDTTIRTITRTLKGTKAQLKALNAYAVKIGVEWIK